MNSHQQNRPVDQQELHDLIVRAIGREPLDEQRIAATLQRAAARLQRRRLVRRSLLATAAASLVVLLAAGYWRWSGEDSQGGLSYRTAMELVLRPGNYKRENVQAAAGKVSHDIDQALRLLIAQGALTPTLHDSVLQSLDSPERLPHAYGDGFEELFWLVRSGQPLTPEQDAELAHAMCAGISAIRRFAEVDETRIRLVNKMRQRLRDLLEPPPAATDPAGK
jgi:hypothetical protein